MLTNDMKYAVPLLLLADEIRCEEAINNCLCFISQNLTKPHFEVDFEVYFKEYNQSAWELLIEKKQLRDNSKTKLMALTIKNISKNLTLTKCNDCEEKTKKNRYDLISIADELIKISKNAIRK